MIIKNILNSPPFDIYKPFRFQYCCLTPVLTDPKIEFSHETVCFDSLHDVHEKPVQILCCSIKDLTQGGFDYGGVFQTVATADRADERGVIEKDHFGLIAASSAELR